MLPGKINTICIFSSYMQWVEENFPENKEYLTTLLEHLMKEFLDKKRYHNDQGSSTIV